MKGRASRLVRLGTSCAVAAVFALALAGGGLTTITTTGSATDLAAAITTDPAVVTGASLVAVPPNGTPNAVADSASSLGGFPTAGSTYAILTTGNANLADDPNDSEGSGANLAGFNVRGDTDYDVTILKIDLNVPAGRNCLTFDFRFLSEEFPEFVDSQYNDAFIAELDTSDWTTSGSDITAPHNFAFDPTNNVISINAAGATSMTAGNATGTTYDGATPLLAASTPITAGAHSLYLSIFDQGDMILDSAVFIDALVLGTTAPGGCVAGATVLTTAKAADSPSTVAGGSNGYTITISNPSSSAVTLNSIFDVLPAGFSYVTGSTTGATTANPTISSQTLTWAGPFTVPAGGNISLHFGVTVSSTPGDYFNDAGGTAATGAVTPTGPTAKITVTPAPVASADLVLTKTDSPDPVTVGQTLTYTLTVQNNGPDAAAGVTVTDTLPATVTLGTVTPSQGTCSGTTTITCNLGSLANGATATITITVTPTNDTDLSNTATVSSSTGDPTPGNNSDTETTTVNAAPVASADLVVTKTDSPDPVIVGQTLTYTISVHNNGPDTAAGVSVSDTLPATVSLGTVTPSVGTCSGTTTITCNFGNLANGATATVTITVTPTNDTDLSNTATVSSTTGDPTSANNTDTETTTVNPAPVASADLVVTKTDSPDPVLVGQTLTYTITVHNNGPDAAAGVTLSDPLPATVSLGTVTASQGTCSGTTTITCNLGNLANGATATVTITVTPTNDTDLSNTASAASTTSDPTPANNSDTEATTVNPVPVASADLVLTKTDSPDPVTVGQNLTYTLSVHNNGPDPAAAVSVSDPLPATVAFVSVSTTQGTCVGGTTTTCTLGSVASGATVTITLVVTPTNDTDLSNTATVSSTTADPTPGNNSDTEATVVNQVNKPPTCSAVTASPAVLWPPNHGLVLVRLSGATDPDGDPVTLTVTGVTQDEPVDNPFQPDAVLADEPDEVWIRSERDGAGDGRVYRIAFTGTDGKGGTCQGVATVRVPHDMKHGAVDSGSAFDSTGVAFANPLVGLHSRLGA